MVLHFPHDDPYSALSAAVIRQAAHDMQKSIKRWDHDDEKIRNAARATYAECRRFLLSVDSPYHSMLKLDNDVYTRIVEQIEDSAGLHN